MRSLRAGLDTTAPVEVSVSFGIELSVQAGRIVSAIAGAGGQASLSVSLTWTEPVSEGDGTVPGPRAGGGTATGSSASGAV